MILIGYSGHAYIAICIIHAGKTQVEGYCDKEEKQNNPFALKYFGSSLFNKIYAAYKPFDIISNFAALGYASPIVFREQQKQMTENLKS